MCPLYRDYFIKRRAIVFFLYSENIIMNNKIFWFINLRIDLKLIDKLVISNYNIIVSYH